MKELLGSIQSAELKDHALLNQSKLSEPLEWTEAVCRCWCKQCGTIKEISSKTMKKLQKISGQEFTGSLRDIYFEVSYCEYCAPNELSIRIKNI